MEMKQVVNGLSEILVGHWNSFKDALYNKETETLSLEEIIEKYTFFSVFDDLVNARAPQFEIPIKGLGRIYRGVGVNEEIELDFFQRMIPHSNYVKNHNRMNPPGEAFIYLAVIPIKKGRSDATEKKLYFKNDRSRTASKKRRLLYKCTIRTQER